MSASHVLKIAGANSTKNATEASLTLNIPLEGLLADSSFG